MCPTLVFISPTHYVSGNCPHVGSGSLASGASSPRFICMVK